MRTIVGCPFDEQINYSFKSIETMKTFEITKERILLLADQHSWSEKKLKQWFPEAFKPKLEYGRWLKTDDSENKEWLIFQINNNSYYGFDGFWNWVDLKSTNYDATKDISNRYATEEEVKTALIAEAKRRGFKKGVQHTRANGWSNPIAENTNFGFDEYSNKLLFNNWCIFLNGKWAEIISKPIELTLEQIAEKFNVNVEQLKIKK